MEIGEAEEVKMCHNLTATHMDYASAETTSKGRRFTYDEEDNTKATQTPGHVFLGKLGEVIISTNYNLVKLVINDTALQRLADHNFHLDQLQDIVVTSLARLDWNGEKILDKAMTSFRLTLTNELMPQLLKEVIDVMKSEAERHQIQHLIEKLFDDFRVRLFGFDVTSLVFLLEHCSVDDANVTSESKEKQVELQEILVTLLPLWVGQSAVWDVNRYTLSLTDRCRDFGYQNFSVVSMTASVKTATASLESAATTVEPSTLDADEPVVVSTAQQVSTTQAQSLAEASSFAQPPSSYVDQPSTSGLGQPSSSYLSETIPDVDLPVLTESMETDPPEEVDFRFIMLGRTGSGKSSTANTIFGQEAFPAFMSFSSVTTECQLRTITKDGVSLQILDCPGLFDTGMTNEEVSGLVMKAVSTLDDGPDAVLYIVKIGKYTEEEFAVYHMLKALLDENVTRYLVIVFTHGDVIRGADFDDVIKNTPPTLQQVLKECGNRYVVFDNTAQEERTQVHRLFDLVRKMKTDNHGRPYRCPKYAEKLVEMDEELERRLLKVEQERLERKRYVKKLRSQLAEAERSLAKEKEELRLKEKESERDAQKRIQAMQQRIKELAEARKAGKGSDQEREREMEALKAQAEKERQEMSLRMDQERRMREEELRRMELERENAVRMLRESAAAMEQEHARQREQYSSLQSEMMRVRRRRRNDCCVM